MSGLWGTEGYTEPCGAFLRTMETLRESLTQHTAEILLGLATAVVLLFFWTLRLARAQAKLNRLRKELVLNPSSSGVEGMSLATAGLQGSLGELEARVAELEERAHQAKRHLGLVRYDAFEDVGGLQSFSLALYDDQGDGAIVSGLVGRADCRVYAKAIFGGRAERELTAEEKLAVRAAARQAREAAPQGRA